MQPTATEMSARQTGADPAIRLGLRSPELHAAPKDHGSDEPAAQGGDAEPARRRRRRATPGRADYRVPVRARRADQGRGGRP
jgi:hypothetical protein